MNKKYFFIVCFFVSLVFQAKAFAVDYSWEKREKDENKQLLITARYEHQTKNLVDKLMAFRAHFGLEDRPAPSVYQKDGNPESIYEFTSDIYPLLPDGIQRLLFTNPQNFAKFGPNCWNSVAVSMGQSYISSFGHLSPYTDQFCRRLDSEEALEMGDIGSIEHYPKESKWGSSVHGYVYLDDFLAFTKNGPDKEEAYKFADQLSMMKFYDVSPACYRPASSRKAHENGCERYLVYYRCQWDAPKDYGKTDALIQLEQLVEKYYLKQLAEPEKKILVDLYGQLALELYRKTPEQRERISQNLRYQYFIHGNAGDIAHKILRETRPPGYNELGQIMSDIMEVNSRVMDKERQLPDYELKTDPEKWKDLWLYKTF